MMEPSSMSAMNEFQCPLTGKKFPFILRDRASRKEALAQQQAHTGGVIQRLERLAGKKLSYREQRQEAQREQAAAKLAEAKAAEEAAKKPKEPDPFVEQIFRFSPYVN
jgi:hypothetical protein